MARPRRIDKALVAKARQVVAHTTELEQLRAAQAVLLPALVSATLEQTAAILGVGRATVPRLQQRLRQSVRSRATRPRWGGRRKALMSAEQEAEFLTQPDDKKSQPPAATRAVASLCQALFSSNGFLYID